MMAGLRLHRASDRHRTVGSNADRALLYRINRPAAHSYSVHRELAREKSKSDAHHHQASPYTQLSSHSLLGMLLCWGMVRYLMFSHM